MMKALATGISLAAVAATAAAPGLALAQASDKPTVAKYLADGYTVLRAEIGSPFLQFILQKSTATGQVLVWCSVMVQSGETSSCRTIK